MSINTLYKSYYRIILPVDFGLSFRNLTDFVFTIALSNYTFMKIKYYTITYIITIISIKTIIYIYYINISIGIGQSINNIVRIVYRGVMHMYNNNRTIKTFLNNLYVYDSYSYIYIIIIMVYIAHVIKRSVVISRKQQ